MKPNQVNSHNEQHLLNTVYNYNRLVHASRFSPTVITIPATSSNDKRNRKPMQLQRRRAQFKVGDCVRLSKYRTVFERGYTANWTTEHFFIRKVQYNSDPITYLLKDYQNNNIEGSVYEEELQLVKNPKLYLVEKIIRRKKGRAFVKWLGFGPEHNSWIDAKDIV